MNKGVKSAPSPAHCLILCAAAALAGCAIYLFSVSAAEAALDRLWFPFAQIQALTADVDGSTPESVCLVLAALPVFGLIAQLLRQRFKPEDLLLLLCGVLVYMVMKSPLSMAGALTSSLVQPAAVWTVLMAWAGLRILRAGCTEDGMPLVRLCGWAVCAAALYFAYGAGANVGSVVFVLRLNAGSAAVFSQAGLALIAACLGTASCMFTLAALRRYAADGGLSAAAVEAVNRLSRFCAAALASMLLLSAAVELANALLVKQSGGSLRSVNFPASALIYCFAVLLGSRLVAAHKRLKDENDLFV